MKMTVLGIITILIFFIINLSSIVVVNDHNKAFPEPDSGTIEDNVIDGASDFLSSYSKTLLALSGSDATTSKSSSHLNSLEQINSALEKIWAARLKYLNALEIALKSTYLEKQQTQLKSFDYSMIIERLQLDEGIASKVIQFLKSGDIIGVYRSNIKNIDEVVIMLQYIKEVLQNGFQPSEEDIAHLFTIYSNTMLFGNYSTILANYAFESEV